MDTKSSTIKALDILVRLARSNPIGVVDYEDDWSDVTPGAGAIEGCIHCKSTYAIKESGHKDNCIWVEARNLLLKEGYKFET